MSFAGAADRELETLHNEIHELRTELAFVRTELQAMQKVMASLLAKDGASDVGVSHRQDFVSIQSCPTFKECLNEEGLPRTSLLQEDLEGEPWSANVLFELLGAGTGRYGNRTSVRVVLATTMVLIQVNNVRTLDASAKPGLFTCMTGVAAFLLWAATMVHWLCALVQRPQCSLRGIQYKVLVQFSVVSSILFGVSSIVGLLSLASHWDWTPQTYSPWTWLGFLVMVDAGRHTPGHRSLVAGGLRPRDRCGGGNRKQSPSTRGCHLPGSPIEVSMEHFRGVSLRLRAARHGAASSRCVFRH